MVEREPFPLRVPGEHILFNARNIVFDDVVGRREDGLGRAVILIEHDDLRAWEFFVEREHVFYLSPAPGIDALV